MSNKTVSESKKPSPLVGEGGGEAVGRGKCEQKREMILTCVRQHALFASQAWHFPPRSGEAYIKEERIHIFI